MCHLTPPIQKHRDKKGGRAWGGRNCPPHIQTKAASMDTGFGFGVQCLCYTQVGSVQAVCQKARCQSLLLGIGRKHHSEPFHANATAGARKRQRAWCSSMILTNPNQKFANSRGVELESGKEPCEAGKRQRAVRSRKVAKSRAKQESGKEPCEAGRGTLPTYKQT